MFLASRVIKIVPPPMALNVGLVIIAVVLTNVLLIPRAHHNHALLIKLNTMLSYILRPILLPCPATFSRLMQDINVAIIVGAPLLLELQLLVG